MNFKKLSIMMILVGIMVFSVVSVYASCDSNHPCSAGFGCCLSDNQCSDFAAKKNTCVTPEKIKCIAGAADNPSAKAAGDYYCVTQITSLANNYVDCQPIDPSIAFCVVVPKFADDSSCVENRQCISNICSNMKCVPKDATNGPPTPPTVAARTGIFHYGSEIKNGEDISIGTSLLGKLFASLRGMWKDSYYNSHPKLDSQTYRGYTNIVMDNDRSKGIVGEAYVNHSVSSIESIYAIAAGSAFTAVRANSATKSDSATKADSVSDVCVVIGMMFYTKGETIYNNPKFGHTCQGAYAGWQKIEWYWKGDQVHTMKGGVDVAASAGYWPSLVFCCPPSAPTLTKAYIGDCGQTKILQVNTNQPIDYCDFTDSSGTVTSIGHVMLSGDTGGTPEFTNGVYIYNTGKLSSTYIIQRMAKGDSETVTCHANGLDSNPKTVTVVHTGDTC